jgi:hypothetical protein
MNQALVLARVAEKTSTKFNIVTQNNRCFKEIGGIHKKAKMRNENYLSLLEVLKIWNWR